MHQSIEIVSKVGFQEQKNPDVTISYQPQRMHYENQNLLFKWTFFQLFKTQKLRENCASNISSLKGGVVLRAEMDDLDIMMLISTHCN